MAKIYAQNMPEVLRLSGSLASSGSTSGSLVCNGYARLVGLFRSDVITQTGSGLQVQFSSDYGATWDYTSASNVVNASTTTACSTEVLGNAVRIVIRNGATEASALRTVFMLRPV